MKLLNKALMWTIPVWVLLILENYFLNLKFIEWMNLPGIFLVIALKPEWESLHDVDMYLYLILNIVIYFFLIYLLLFAWKKLKVVLGEYAKRNQRGLGNHADAG
jgi:hypothetical protein